MMHRNKDVWSQHRRRADDRGCCRVRQSRRHAPGGSAPARRRRNKYPTTWKGEWTRVVHREVEVQGAFDQTKPFGLGQQAPLTPEYQKVLPDSMADQAKGGLGNYPTARCLPSGMPRMMTFGTQEYVITPETTYILLTGSDHLRRIFTDGRDWPKNPMPTYGGYSIGQLDRRGWRRRYDTLEVETRYFKGPRAFDASGLPLAFDNQSVFKERFFIDKANPNDHPRPHHGDRSCADAAMDVGPAIPARLRKVRCSGPRPGARKAMPTSSSARRTISSALTAC